MKEISEEFQKLYKNAWEEALKQSTAEGNAAFNAAFQKGNYPKTDIPPHSGMLWQFYATIDGVEYGKWVKQ